MGARSRRVSSRLGGVSDAERAAELLAKLAGLENLDPAVIAAQAIGHGILALIAAVESWRPPADDDKPPVPFDQTRAGWSWGNPDG